MMANETRRTICGSVKAKLDAGCVRDRREERLEGAVVERLQRLRLLEVELDVCL